MPAEAGRCFAGGSAAPQEPSRVGTGVGLLRVHGQRRTDASVAEEVEKGEAPIGVGGGQGCREHPRRCSVARRRTFQISVATWKRRFVSFQQK